MFHCKLSKTWLRKKLYIRELIDLNYTFNMPFIASPEAKATINGCFLFQFHNDIHSKILPIFLEMFFRHFIKMNLNAYFKCSLTSRINKLRDTAIELGSKCSFLNTWNSLLNINGSVNCNLISWFFSSFKNLRATLKNTNHPVVTRICKFKSLKRRRV